jgi:sulfotransferase family protein
MKRRKAPVFVVGCHRSGTNLLYDTLLSSGAFAIYRSSLVVYETLIPRFGDLNVYRHREKLMRTWLRSKPFRRSGLNSERIEAKVLGECRNGGDFIRIVMGEIASVQGTERWAVYNPDNILFIRQIKKDLPGALFLHIVRDGRDIAVSLTKMGGLRPLPWDKERAVLATALYWQWTVRQGRDQGRLIGPDYLEVHYEDLVNKPRETLASVGEFIGQSLDYDRICSVGLGRVREPNSSFKGERGKGGFSPVNRWKQKLSLEQIEMTESLIGTCLQEFGYPVVTRVRNGDLAWPVRIMRSLYPRFFTMKLWLKSNTPLGRLANVGSLELMPAKSEDVHPASGAPSVMAAQEQEMDGGHRDKVD